MSAPCSFPFCEHAQSRCLEFLAMYVIELTVPKETNCKIARRRKQDKYRDLRPQLLCPMLEIQSFGQSLSSADV